MTIQIPSLPRTKWQWLGLTAFLYWCSLAWYRCRRNFNDFQTSKTRNITVETVGPLTAGRSSVRHAINTFNTLEDLSNKTIYTALPLFFAYRLWTKNFDFKSSSRIEMALEGTLTVAAAGLNVAGIMRKIQSLRF